MSSRIGALPDAEATQVERRVLPRAAGQMFASFRACVQRAVIAADPRAAEDRHAAAVVERRVEYHTLEGGTTSLYAVLPADDLQAVANAVQSAADALPRAAYPAGPHATDQRRADAFVTDDLVRSIDFGRTVYRPPQAPAEHVAARDRVLPLPWVPASGGALRARSSNRVGRQRHDLPPEPAMPVRSASSSETRRRVVGPRRPGGGSDLDAPDGSRLRRSARGASRRPNAHARR